MIFNCLTFRELVALEGAALATSKLQELAAGEPQGDLFRPSLSSIQSEWRGIRAACWSEFVGVTGPGEL